MQQLELQRSKTQPPQEGGMMSFATWMGNSPGMVQWMSQTGVAAVPGAPGPSEASNAQLYNPTTQIAGTPLAICSSSFACAIPVRVLLLLWLRIIITECVWQTGALWRRWTGLSGGRCVRVLRVPKAAETRSPALLNFALSPAASSLPLCTFLNLYSQINLSIHEYII